MIFKQALRRELSFTTGGVFLVLVTIMVTTLVIRILGFAANGTVNPKDALVLITLATLGYMAVLLTVSLFVAVLIVLVRWYKDSEMIVWFASGLSISNLIRPILQFATPLIIMIALLALFVWPWSNQKIQELVDRFEKRGDLERVTPGQFQESANGQRVFFIDKASTVKGQGNNVFIATKEGDKQTMTTALHGHIENKQTGEKFLILNNGQQLIYSNTGETLKLSEFQEYGAQIGKTDLNIGQPVPRALDTLFLVLNPSAQNSSELVFRIGLVFTSFNLIVISLALASVNPRAGKSAPLMLALFRNDPFFFCHKHTPYNSR